MRCCNRCGDPLPPDFMQVQFPFFYITKSKSLLDCRQIELCTSCSKELDEWLNNKEYEPKAIPDPEFGKSYKDWYCGKCGEHIDPEFDFYCSSCGAKIKEVEE